MTFTQNEASIKDSNDCGNMEGSLFLEDALTHDVVFYIKFGKKHSGLKADIMSCLDMYLLPYNMLAEMSDIILIIPKRLFVNPDQTIQCQSCKNCITIVHGFILAEFLSEHSWFPENVLKISFNVL